MSTKNIEPKVNALLSFDEGELGLPLSPIKLETKELSRDLPGLMSGSLPPILPHKSSEGVSVKEILKIVSKF